MILESKLESIDWQKVASSLNLNGYALIPKVLSESQCHKLIEGYGNHRWYRKKVIMERHRFGLGAYKYFSYPLPALIQELRVGIYRYLSPVANLWMQLLNIGTRFPETHQAFMAQCQASGQRQPTPLLLKYGVGGYNTLHQDMYGEVYFPLQTAFFLSQPREDYNGGEFVLTEQVPRAQSKVKVLRPEEGDMIIFSTNFRPMKGSRGYYRANMRHGVSEITSGERFTLGVIFHDAVS